MGRCGGPESREPGLGAGGLPGPGHRAPGREKPGARGGAAGVEAPSAVGGGGAKGEGRGRRAGNWGTEGKGGGAEGQRSERQGRGRRSGRPGVGAPRAGGGERPAGGRGAGGRDSAQAAGIPAPRPRGPRLAEAPRPPARGPPLKADAPRTEPAAAAESQKRIRPNKRGRALHAPFSQCVRLSADLRCFPYVEWKRRPARPRGSRLRTWVRISSERMGWALRGAGGGAVGCPWMAGSPRLHGLGERVWTLGSGT